jgi:hypothetical protein
MSVQASKEPITPKCPTMTNIEQMLQLFIFLPTKHVRMHQFQLFTLGRLSLYRTTNKHTDRHVRHPQTHLPAGYQTQSHRRDVSNPRAISCRVSGPGNVQNEGRPMYNALQRPIIRGDTTLTTNVIIQNETISQRKTPTTKQLVSRWM